jgi:CubicO group peptidase (beta-lactamase class C family)
LRADIEMPSFDRQSSQPRGQFSWPGASGTDWWADPKEELAVVYLSAAPGPIRWHYRQKINAMVYQAIIE